jgi:hypothetical protein
MRSAYWVAGPFSRKRHFPLNDVGLVSLTSRGVRPYIDSFIRHAIQYVFVERVCELGASEAYWSTHVYEYDASGSGWERVASSYDASLDTQEWTLELLKGMGNQAMPGRGKLKIAEAQNVLTMDCEQLVSSLLVSADSIGTWIVADDAGGH